MLDQVWQNSVTQYAKIGVKLVRVKTSETAHIRQSFRSLGGSTIGLAEFNNRTCGDSVFNYRSSSYRAGMDYQMNLDLHELGHNHNLEHTSGGIMNPSINNSPSKWVEFDSDGRITYKDVSYATLTRFYGGKPVDPPPPTNLAPVVIITKPQNADGFEYNGRIETFASIKDDKGIVSVKLLADGVVKETAPIDNVRVLDYRQSISATPYAPGMHLLSVEAMDADAKSTRDSVSILIKAAELPPPPPVPPPDKPPKSWREWLQGWLDLIFTRTLKP